MITTIPELNEFLAEKTKRLEEEDRIRRESAAARQLAAARKLEEETATVAVPGSPQGNAAITWDRTIPSRPTDNQLITAVAIAFGVDLSDALEWLSTFGK